MEIAGLAVGVAGLVGLFGACMGAMEHLHSYKIAGHESSYIIAAFNADKLLFQRWADGVGIADNKLKDVHHPDLNNALVASVVGNILSSIRDIFKMTDSISSKLLIASIDSEISSLQTTKGPSKGNLIGMKNSQPLASRRARVSWALGGKTNLTAQVEVFGLLVAKLYRVIPIEKAEIPVLFAESQRVFHELLDFQKGEIRKELYSWLDAIITPENLESCLSAHLPRTCGWVFRDAAYSSWRSPEFDDNLAKFLWVYGPAGHGKSVLCAQLINSLKDASEAPVAYFFCSSENKTQREPLAIIRSWIWQAIDSHENALEQALEIRAKEMRLASRTDVWKLFGSIVTMIPNYTFIVDGLDECLRSSDDWRSPGNSSRIDFLMSLKASVAHTRTRILITSRDEGDIRSELSPDSVNADGQRLYECRLSKEILKPDITLFSKSVVNRKLANKNSALREDLAAQMAQRSEGMFLLIKLSENRLSRSKNRKQLEAVISNMPSELEHAYERDWKYISKLPNRDRFRALEILRWATFALRPVTVSEITEALLIEDNDNCDDLQIDELPDEVNKDFVDEQIIGLCGSLLEIRASSVEKKQSPRSSTIHLAHFSVKEYLLTMIPDKAVSFSDHNYQNSYLAKLCLRYLNYAKVWLASSSPENNERQHLFLDYAVKSWHKHAAMGGESNSELIDLTNKFFTPGNPTWDRWREHFESIAEPPLSGSEEPGSGPSLSDIEQPGEEPPLSAIEQPREEPSLLNTEQPGGESSLSDIKRARETPGSSLYYAALFGLVNTMEFLRNQKDFDPNVLGGTYGTPLQAACAQGNLSTVRFLVRFGADINIQGGEYGRAIIAAMVSGDDHFEIVEFLLDKGADIAVVDQDGDTPLMHAAYDGHIEVAKLLLERGANLDVANNNGFTPLSQAIYKGHLEMVKFLLDRGANILVMDQDGDTPLMDAAYDGHIEVAKLLLERGANLDIANNHGVTPLSQAIYNGHLEMVKFLLDRGANILVMDQVGDTPLMHAAYDGPIEVAKLLLERGANLDIANNHGFTPLSLAIYNGHLEMVKFLLDRGANILVMDQNGDTPLTPAAYDGHIEVAKLLLERGANLDIANNHGVTPLSQAIYNGHLEMVKFLLDRGANILAMDQDGDTPLMHAAYYGHIEVAKLLLERGANLDIANNHGFTPLSQAICNGHLEMVKFLLDRGANILVMDQDGDTPLMHAAYDGHIEVARILLDKGANAAVVSNEGLTPLRLAIYNGHLEMVKFLLDRGANILVMDQDGDTPLMHAAYDGHIEVAKLLLERGANLDIANNNGVTPLSRAIYKGHLEMVKFLLDRGANILVMDQDGDTPLMHAAYDGHIEVAKLLLERGANLDIANNHGFTPLSQAIYNGHLEMVKFLLDRGANILVMDQDGDTPLMRAITGGHLEVIRLLLDRGAPLARADNAGITPLCLAANQGHLEIVKLLLERGVDAAMSSEQRNKALDNATAKGNLEVIELLNIAFKLKSEQDSESPSKPPDQARNPQSAPKPIQEN